ncbi:hypothetical protein [Lacinutrix undariae]
MNCQKEDIQKESSTNVEDTNSTSDIKGLIIKTDSVFIANNFLREQISSKFSTTNNSNARTITSSTYGFSIDTTRVQVLASDTFESYTFVIERDEPNNDILENYILTRFNDGSFSQMLLSYPIVTIDGNFSYDISNINGQYINDISLLTARSSPCSWSGDEVMAWDPNGGDSIEFSCGGATGNGKHGYGQSGCKAQGDDRASQRCTGAYVAIDCIFGGPGSSTGTTNPVGGTTTNPIPNPTPEPTPVLVVPVEAPLESAILNFLYGYNMEFLNQNYDNTPVREEMLQNLTDEQKQSIYNYTRKFGISDADKKEFIEIAVEAMEEGAIVYFDDLLMLDPTFLANQKVKCVYERLSQISDSYFSSILESFDNNKVSKLAFKVANIPQNNPTVYYNAKTLPTYGGGGSIRTIDIYLDQNFIQNSSLIEIAFALIHESIHAEIMERCFQLGIITSMTSSGFGVTTITYSNGQVISSDIPDYIFASLISQYVNTSNPNPNWQHEIYSPLNYITKISEDLEQAHPLLDDTTNPFENNLNTNSLLNLTMDEYFESMSWLGLQNTQEYNNLDPLSLSKISQSHQQTQAHYNQNCN